MSELYKAIQVGDHNSSLSDDATSNMGETQK